MSGALQRAIASGEYRVDSDVVAAAMIARARALRAARHGAACSGVLVAPERIEIRRIGTREGEAVSLKDTA
jgi:hypothetical protein